MGIAKRLWMEAEDYVWAETTAEFACPKCGQLSSCYTEIPKIAEENPDELNPDVTVQCSECGEDFEVSVSLGVSGCSAVIDDYPDVDISIEPVYFSSYEDDDYWLEDEYFNLHSKDPHPVFLRSLEEVTTFLDKHGVKDGSDAMNRMIFAQCFSMYEAYLCDTFLNLVFSNETNQNVILNQHNELKKFSVPIAELINHRELTVDKIIRAKINSIIRETLFHNLAKVIQLYGMFKIGIFDDDKIKNALFEAVVLRHHCVHRNGYDKEGERLEVYTESYIKEIADAMLSSVNCIESNISKSELDGVVF